MNANGIASKIDSRLNQIQKTSSYFRAAFWLVAFLGATKILGCVYPVFLAPNVASVIKFRFAMTACSDVAYIAIALFGIKLFNIYQQGKLFSSQANVCLCNIGYSYLLMESFAFCSQMIESHFEHHPDLVIGNFVWTLDLLNIFCRLVPGVLILFLSRIMDEGRKIQEEQELTV